MQIPCVFVCGTEMQIYSKNKALSRGWFCWSEDNFNGNINNGDCFIAHLIMWIMVLMGVVVLVLLLVVVIVGLLLQ